MATNTHNRISIMKEPARVAPTLATAPMNTYMSKTSRRLPKDPTELKSFLSSGHKASKLVGSSLKAHRSPYESMIFLYGLTGAGKSSTLNHLFKYDLIPTSARQSCTRTVVELVATMDSPHWDVTGLDLGFVDTPGYGDTSFSDMENIAKVDCFISKHPFLKSEFAPFKFYPNIVLIVSSIIDNRMVGENSNFSKMLRILSKLNIVDKARPNVVIVLTHAMFIRPERQYTELVENKKNLVKNLVRLYFEIDVPIVILDNVTEGLEIEGDWTVLPDMSKQPLNLFEAMVSLMKKSGDEIGIESIRLLFGNRKDFRICEERKFGSEGGIFEHAVVSTLDISKWEDLKESMNKFPKLIDGQIKKEILLCIKENRYPHLNLTEDLILPLLYRLQEVNIFNLTDFMDKNIEEVNRLLYPFKLNKEERILIFELFKVKPLQTLKNLDHLGCGYLLSDQILKFPIISAEEMKYCYEIGTQIPVFSNFVSKGRLLIHCEFEWLKKSILSSRKPTIMFSVQHELFNVNIDVSTVKFERTFVNAAKSLPTYETDPDENTIKAYKSFFDKYGTHCILRLSYGGHINGSIEFPFTTEISSDMMNAQAKKVEHLLWIFFETCQNYNNSISDYKSILDPNSHELFDKIMKSSIKCVGGNKIFSNSKMEDINPTRWSEWVNSLNRNWTQKFNSGVVIFLNQQNENTKNRIPNIST